LKKQADLAWDKIGKLILILLVLIIVIMIIFLFKDKLYETSGKLTDVLRFGI